MDHTKRRSVRTTARRATRLATVAALALLPSVALGATPAHAVTSCLVNGVAVTGNVNGTPFNDTIRCSGVDRDTFVDGHGGDDVIILDGVVEGRVFGGDGADHIMVRSPGYVEGKVNGGHGPDRIDITTVQPHGRVQGADGNDTIDVHYNRGIVDAGDGFDFCLVERGHPALNCP
ncbi:hypothetical protein GCM10010218_42400 [Streptomyces mashuensis]|uniref:Uncharacterized protein n=1 Tax=Streptomyces mashuensis TaxID=33904 RepID=A0A919B4R2_9ACTN|nr:hypothetical protein [Streptomyces mashuensis]GHF56586.1 hypothetical protein GCM10010218_42400 [Streptomyces mashuensis]